MSHKNTGLFNLDYVWNADQIRFSVSKFFLILRSRDKEAQAAHSTVILYKVL